MREMCRMLQFQGPDCQKSNKPMVRDSHEHSGFQNKQRSDDPQSVGFGLTMWRVQVEQKSKAFSTMTTNESSVGGRSKSPCSQPASTHPSIRSAHPPSKHQPARHTASSPCKFSTPGSSKTCGRVKIIDLSETLSCMVVAALEKHSQAWSME